MTPEQIAKSGSEHAHQSALFAQAAISVGKYPMLEWMFAIPNGGARGNDSQTCMIRGGMMKAEGVKAGVYDICLPYAMHNCHGLFIEMKKPGEQTKKNGGRSDEQVKFGKYVTENGYASIVCYSWVEAWSVIEQYLNPKLF